MTHLASYPKLWNLGHPSIRELFEGPVVLQEKVDGSQFSFGVTVEGELIARSKGKDIVLDAPDKMFNLAVQTVMELRPLLYPGYIYRGEYLRSPNHNTLTYNRIPAKHIIIFDVSDGEFGYRMPEFVQKEAERLGLEAVPTFHAGQIDSFDAFMALLERESCLGGPIIEGVAIKNYTRFGVDGKPLFGKYVRQSFKEENQTAFKVKNPTAGDVVQNIIATYRNENRWRKARQHLLEAGELSNTPQDIGKLLKEMQRDTGIEAKDEILQALWKYAWPHIQRGIVRGMPEWYKDELAKSQFEDTLDTDATP